MTVSITIIGVMPPSMMTLSKLALRVMPLSVIVFSMTISIKHHYTQHVGTQHKDSHYYDKKIVKICVRVEQIMMNVVWLSVVAPGLEHRFE